MKTLPPKIQNIFDRLDQEYGLTPHDLEIEGDIISLVTIGKVDMLLEELLAKGDTHIDVTDERLPYWAELWPSAIGLSKYIRSRNLVQPGTSVLELGCGLGLPGIVASKMGGKVVLSDYLKEALQFARLNWWLNLDFEPELTQLDWREPDPVFAADVLMASDVAYEERAFEPLFLALKTLVKPGGTILLSEPSRPIAKPFLEELRNMGKSVTETVVPVNFIHLQNQVAVFEIKND